MEAKQMQDSNSKNSQVNIFEGKVAMSRFQPIDVKPLYGRKWITNGIANANFQVYKDAYDDSPTNSSIINAFVNYVYGEGLIDVYGQDLSKYISQEDVLLICQDFKIYGGYALQIIWNSATNLAEKKPIKVEYIPVYKLGVNYDMTTLQINGYWYSYDWKNIARYKAQLYPNFTGEYKNDDLEILMVRRPTAEPFFPVPDYLSGIPWAFVEGDLANAGKNHFKNSLTAMTIINYNNGRILDYDVAQQKADEVRTKVVGTDNQSAVIVAFNESAEEAVTVDQLSPPELNNQNVFYSEEAERKLIVAHSAPPILFSGSNSGSGFSSNADEIAVATKGLYRRHINPMRGIILKGFDKVFRIIDPSIKLDFKDYKEETEITTADNNGVVQMPQNETLDSKTLDAQAQLKGSVGGVQSILEVQASYVAGTTSYESAIAILDLIFGFNREQAIRLLGNPEKTTETTPIL
jgi:hypothetical protein